MISQKKQKKRATLAEKNVAADLGGRKTFLSGAGDEKADVVVPGKVTIQNGELRDLSMYSFRVEVKTTRADSYTLTSRSWQDLIVAADKAGQAPVFVMEIDIARLPFKLAAIRSNFYQELSTITVPLDPSDVHRKSVTLHRLSSTAVSKVRRVWFGLQLQYPGRKGDVTIMEYDEFLRLVKKAGA